MVNRPHIAAKASRSRSCNSKGINMKAITIRQPFAALIVLGLKQFETRGWHIRYRGELAIHAAAIADEQQVAAAKQVATEYGMAKESVWQTGAVVGTAMLAGIAPAHTVGASSLDLEYGDFSAGRFAWRMEQPIPMPKPIPCAGQQRIWQWKRPTRATASQMMDRVILKEAYSQVRELAEMERQRDAEIRQHVWDYYTHQTPYKKEFWRCGLERLGGVFTRAFGEGDRAYLPRFDELAIDMANGDFPEFRPTEEQDAAEKLFDYLNRPYIRKASRTELQQQAREMATAVINAGNIGKEEEEVPF